MSTASYDVIVIGAGPAGLVTATEVARTGLKTLCIDKLAPGGQLINLTELHEFEEPWGGPDIARLTDEAAVAGVEVGFGDVSKISGGAPWTVETADGESHTARLLVIATGLNKGKLGLPNEADFEGPRNLDLRGLRRSAVRRPARGRGRCRRLGAHRSARACRCGGRGHDRRRLRSQDT